MNTRHRLALAASAFAAGVLAAPLAAQQSQSGPPAAELARLLAARHIEHIAAPDPDEAGRFVAALLAPGPTLLVVSVRYPVPAALEPALAKRQYASAYADLNGAGIAESKLFVHDMGADGLLSGPRKDGVFDIVYERVVKQTLFDGDWEAQGLRAEDYQAYFRTIDAKYARMLSLLLAELEKGG